MEIITKYDLEQEVFYLTADGIRSGIIKEIKCNVSISEIGCQVHGHYEIYRNKLIHISYKVQPNRKDAEELELDENKLYSTKEELKESL